MLQPRLLPNFLDLVWEPLVANNLKFDHLGKIAIMLRDGIAWQAEVLVHRAYSVPSAFQAYSKLMQTQLPEDRSIFTTLNDKMGI